MPKTKKTESVKSPKQLIDQTTSHSSTSDSATGVMQALKQADSPKSNQPNINHSHSDMKSSPTKTIFITIAIVLAGMVTGYGISKAYKPSKASKTTSTQQTTQVQDSVQVGDTYGSQDKETFRDPAEGVLVKGGIDGEGSHHLLREGGPSRNVYLTSSVVDLDKLENHRIKVWGETFAAQKAGWLMDVGVVEVLELNAPKPFEEEPVEPLPEVQ